MATYIEADKVRDNVDWEPSDSLKIIHQIAFGYSRSVIEDHWGNPYKERHEIVWHPAGMVRMAGIAGWITALSQSEETQPLSNKLADDIVTQLYRLNGSGESPVSSTRVVIGDDGTFNGFTLLWHNLVKEDEDPGRFAKRNQDLRREGLHFGLLDEGCATYDYAPGYNGGLLYHGPGCGETFAVVIGNSPLWSIHT